MAGRFAALALRVLPDDLSAPPAGSARVRVLSGASTPPGGTLTGASGRSVPLPPGAGTSVVLPAGAVTVRLRAGSGAVADLPVALRSGSVVSLVVLDRPAGGLTLSVVVDAAGPSVTPRGPVDAGGGGTAGVPVAPLVAGVALSLVGAAAGVRGRRRVVLGAAAALVLATVAPATAAEPSAVGRPAAPPALVATVAPQAAPGAPPVRVRVPAAGVDAAVSPIDVDRSGALLPPPDTARAGWFSGSPVPGDVGPAVIAGHVDASPARPCSSGSRGWPPATTSWSTAPTARRCASRSPGGPLPEDRLPDRGGLRADAGAELRLITCGGAVRPRRAQLPRQRRGRLARS